VAKPAGRNKFIVAARRRSARAAGLVSFTTDAEAAAVILADPAKYDGLPLEWARMWTGRRRLALNARGVPVDYDGQYKAMTIALAKAGWMSHWRNDESGQLRLYWRKPDATVWRVTAEAYEAMMDEQTQGSLFRESA